MVNPITPQNRVTLAVPEALMPPGLRADSDGKISLPLHYSRRDWANAEWKLKMPLLGPRSGEFWSCGASTFQLGVLLFVGLQRALPRMTLDDAHDLIPMSEYDGIEVAVMDAVQAALPAPKENAERQEAGEAESPLPSPSGGSEPGPQPDTISG